MTEAEELDHITNIIIGAAINVHRALGPGLLESAYEACMVFELADRGMSIEQQKQMPVVYRGVTLDCGYRLDKLLPIHEAQMLSYLKLSECNACPLINFNVKYLKDGLKRIANKFPDFPNSRQTRR